MPLVAVVEICHVRTTHLPISAPPESEVGGCIIMPRSSHVNAFKPLNKTPLDAAPAARYAPRCPLNPRSPRAGEPAHVPLALIGLRAVAPPTHSRVPRMTHHRLSRFSTRTIVTCLAALALWPVLLCAQTPLTPEAVSQRIASTGARATLGAIYEDYRAWQELLAGIATGTPGWLKLAVRLQRVSDAGASEQLKLAAGEALEHRPRTVLELAVPAFGIEYVCGVPDVDDVRYASYDLAVQAIEQRKRMLLSVTIPRLRAVRDQCIATLEEARSPLARFYEVPQ
jgi:hypothetical protein